MSRWHCHLLQAVKNGDPSRSNKTIKNHNSNRSSNSNNKNKWNNTLITKKTLRQMWAHCQQHDEAIEFLIVQKINHSSDRRWSKSRVLSSGQEKPLHSKKVSWSTLISRALWDSFVGFLLQNQYFHCLFSVFSEFYAIFTILTLKVSLYTFYSPLSFLFIYHSIKKLCKPLNCHRMKQLPNISALFCMFLTPVMWNNYNNYQRLVPKRR